MPGVTAGSLDLRFLAFTDLECTLKGEGPPGLSLPQLRPTLELQIISLVQTMYHLATMVCAVDHVV